MRLKNLFEKHTGRRKKAKKTIAKNEKRGLCFCHSLLGEKEVKESGKSYLFTELSSFSYMRIALATEHISETAYEYRFCLLEDSLFLSVEAIEAEENHLHELIQQPQHSAADALDHNNQVLD